jgi:hypothetical protein
MGNKNHAENSYVMMRFIIVTYIKDVEMGGECSTYSREICIEFWWETSRKDTA